MFMVRNLRKQPLLQIQDEEKGKVVFKDIPVGGRLVFATKSAQLMEYEKRKDISIREIE